MKGKETIIHSTRIEYDGKEIVTNLLSVEGHKNNILDVNGERFTVSGKVKTVNEAIINLLNKEEVSKW